MTGDLHVLAVPGGWAVQSETQPAALSRHNLQEEAIESGRAFAIEANTDLIVHGVNGEIQFRESYREPTLASGGPPTGFGTPNA